MMRGRNTLRFRGELGGHHLAAGPGTHSNPPAIEAGRATERSVIVGWVGNHRNVDNIDLAIGSRRLPVKGVACPAA